MTPRLKLHVIACPSLRPELDGLAAARGEISLQYLDMAWHERSAAALRQALQTAIDKADPCDAIALGYGLCNRGIIGLTARTVPLVIPRAHDCIGILLGSNARYRREMEDEPGTYFESAGWLTQTRDIDQPSSILGPTASDNFERLAKQYGEDAARYLCDQLDGLNRHYKRLSFIATPLAASATFEAQAKAIAGTRKLEYRRLQSDARWIAGLLEGNWPDSEFLVVRPHQKIVAGNSDRLIEAI